MCFSPDPPQTTALTLELPFDRKTWSMFIIITECTAYRHIQDNFFIHFYFPHVWSVVASWKQTFAPPAPPPTYITSKKYCDLLIQITRTYSKKCVNSLKLMNLLEWLQAAKHHFKKQLHVVKFSLCNAILHNSSESTYIFHQAHSKTWGACTARAANKTANLWTQVGYFKAEVWASFVQFFRSA